MTTVKIMFLIISILILSVHISTAFSRRKNAEILSYVNLTLHIFAFVLLMLLEVTVEFLALYFMVSLLFYLLSSLFSFGLKKKEGKSDDV